MLNNFNIPINKISNFNNENYQDKFYFEKEEYAIEKNDTDNQNMHYNLINDLLHDVSSTFFNVYFAFEMINIKNDSLSEILNNSLFTLRKQLECYKAIFSENYDETIKTLTNYLNTIEVNVIWKNLDCKDKSIVENKIIGLMILFFTKRSLKKCNLEIIKSDDLEEFLLKFIISKKIFLRESDIKSLTENTNNSDCSYLEMLLNLLSIQNKKISVDQSKNSTIVMIY